MTTSEDNIYNLAVDRASLLFKRAMEKIKEQTKSVPLGMKPKSAKEQMEWYLKLKPQDKMELYRQYGHQNFINMVADMERLKERSAQAWRRTNELEEEEL